MSAGRLLWCEYHANVGWSAAFLQKAQAPIKLHCPAHLKYAQSQRNTTPLRLRHDTTDNLCSYSLPLKARTHLNLVQDHFVRAVFYAEHSDRHISSDDDRRLWQRPLLLEDLAVPRFVPGSKLPDDELVVDLSIQLKCKFAIGCGSGTQRYR